MIDRAELAGLQENLTRSHPPRLEDPGWGNLRGEQASSRAIRCAVGQPAPALLPPQVIDQQKQQANLPPLPPPKVIDQQKQQANLPPALSFVAADFFKPVPDALMEGGGLDAAIFKFILHDWDDKVG